MSAAYLVIYEGEPQDPEAFLAYYREQHVPIIWTWPGIRSVELALGTSGGDPEAADAGVFMIARFGFDSLDDLRRALASPERQAARRDRSRLPPFDGTIRHQAVEVHEMVE